MNKYLLNTFIVVLLIILIIAINYIIHILYTSKGSDNQSIVTRRPLIMSVIIYPEFSFKGQPKELIKGEYKFSDLGFNKLGSMIVNPGMKVVIVNENGNHTTSEVDEYVDTPYRQDKIQDYFLNPNKIIVSEINLKY